MALSGVLSLDAPPVCDRCQTHSPEPGLGRVGGSPFTDVAVWTHND